MYLIFAILWTIFVLWLVAPRRTRNDDFKDKPNRYK